MSAATDMKMLNGRANSHSANKAARVLKEHGLTISAFIRNSIEHIARTGTVPECGLAPTAKPADHKQLRSLVKAIEARSMPGKNDHPNLSEDELVERLRMERYGY